MRFKTYLSLNEALLGLTFKQTISDIKRNCRPFLSAADNQLLFRGMSKIEVHSTTSDEIDLDKGQFFEHPEARSARDSSKSFNFMFNAGCEMAFGIENIRKQSIFGGGNAYQAMLYGSLCLMFPAGNISFLGSNEISDSMESEGEIYRAIANSGLDDISKILLIRYFSKLSNYTNPHDWVTGDFQAHEDIISAEFNDTLKFALAKAFKTLYRSSGLKDLIASKNEILIYESDGYYTIPVSMVLSEMRAVGIKANDKDVDKIMLQNAF